MIMPFGKHKGKDVDTLPLTYLQWLVENIDLKRGTELRNTVFRRLGISENYYAKLEDKIAKLENDVFYAAWHPAAQQPQPDYGAIYREFALKYHPDRGGSHEVMMVINELFARLRA